MPPADPEIEAAVAAVAAGPLDEGRRRVLADLLLERGDPRGEFLMLQFLLAANQGSGAMRQRAGELWRKHRHEWMAGVETSLTELVVEGGFPSAATIRNGLTKEQRDRLLASPMTATLKSLDAVGDASAALVRAACDPRFHALETVKLHDDASLAGVVDGGVPGRLTRVQLAFVPSLEQLTRLVASPAFSKVRQLSLRVSTWSPPARRFLRRSSEGPSESQPPVRVLEVLSQLATLTQVDLSGVGFGDQALFESVARAWPRLRFERVGSPGTFELVRAPGGTTLTLQNFTLSQLLTLRRAVPPDVTRARLMCKRSYGDAEQREKVLEAWRPLDVVMQ